MNLRVLFLISLFPTFLFAQSIYPEPHNLTNYGQIRYQGINSKEYVNGAFFSKKG